MQYIMRLVLKMISVWTKLTQIIELKQISYKFSNVFTSLKACTCFEMPYNSIVTHNKSGTDTHAGGVYHHALCLAKNLAIRYFAPTRKNPDAVSQSEMGIKNTPTTKLVEVTWRLWRSACIESARAAWSSYTRTDQQAIDWHNWHSCIINHTQSVLITLASWTKPAYFGGKFLYGTE